MRSINIIIGTSMGLGKAIFDLLLMKQQTIGLTSKKHLSNKHNLYYNLEDNNPESTINIKLVNKLKNQNFNLINIYMVSAIYDKKNDTKKDKKRILDINFNNQIKIYYYLKEKFSNFCFNIIFFASFEMFKEKSKLPIYSSSKKLYLDEYYKLYNETNTTIKIFILGGILTETYIYNTKYTNKNFLKSFLISNVDKAASFIIFNSRKGRNKIIYYPKKYYFLYNFFKFINFFKL